MGLLKTGLKAAVAVKTAHYVHDRIESRQQAQWAAQGPHAAGAGTHAPPIPPGQYPGYGAAPIAAVATSAPYPTAPIAAEAPAAPPPGGGQDRSLVLGQLKDLAELKAAGVLTDDEFAQQKALILGG